MHSTTVFHILDGGNYGRNHEAKLILQEKLAMIEAFSLIAFGYISLIVFNFFRSMGQRLKSIEKEVASIRRLLKLQTQSDNTEHDNAE